MGAELSTAARTVCGVADAAAYFAHRSATASTPEFLLNADLDLISSNAAGLALCERPTVMSRHRNRLILPHRAQEEALRAFLKGLGDRAGGWIYDTGKERFVMRAERIMPSDRPPAYLLTIQSMDADERYVWADVEGAFGVTASEARVLRLLISGRSVDELSVSLSISVQTARTHVRRLYAKLGVKNREQMFSVVLPYRIG